MPVYVVKRKRKRDFENVSKKQKDRLHCKKRVEDRLDVPYTRRMRDAILKAIREKGGTYLGKLSNTRDVWKNVVPGFPDVRVIYSKKTHEVVTILEEDFKINLR